MRILGDKIIARSQAVDIFVGDDTDVFSRSGFAFSGRGNFRCMFFGDSVVVVAKNRCS